MSSYKSIAIAIFAVVAAVYFSWKGGYDVTSTGNMMIVLGAYLVAFIVLLRSIVNLFRKSEPIKQRLLLFAFALVVPIAPFLFTVPSATDGFVSRMSEVPLFEVRNFGASVRESISKEDVQRIENGGVLTTKIEQLATRFGFLSAGAEPPRIEIRDAVISVIWRAGIGRSVGLDIWSAAVDPSYYQVVGVRYKVRELHPGVVAFSRKS